jgi:hypothetical protein
MRRKGDTLPTTSRQFEPPRAGELVVCALVRPAAQTKKLALLAKQYREWHRKFGARVALLLYLLHAVRSAWPVGTVAIVVCLCGHFFGG